jgi:hypothetical protein
LTDKLPRGADDGAGEGDVMLEQLIESIKTKDSEAIKSMFSEEALEGAVDLDGGIEYVFDFVKGDILSWKAGGDRGGDHIRYGRVVRRGYAYLCHVDTDLEKYLLYFSGFAAYDEHPEKIGLEMLQVIKESDERMQFDGGGTIRCLGIYRPELMTEQLNERRANIKLWDIVESIGEKDGERLKSMFSANAIDTADGMDADIDYLFSLESPWLGAWELQGGGVTESDDGGGVAKKSSYWFLVDVKDEKYIYYMLEYLEDEARPENVGLYMLQVIKEEDAAIQFDEGREILCPGIYRPEKFADVIREREAASAGGAGAETGGGRR